MLFVLSCVFIVLYQYIICRKVQADSKECPAGPCTPAFPACRVGQELSYSRSRQLAAGREAWVAATLAFACQLEERGEPLLAATQVGSLRPETQEGQAADCHLSQPALVAQKSASRHRFISSDVCSCELSLSYHSLISISFSYLSMWSPQ